MKKSLLIITAIALVAIAVLFLKFSGGEDNWICVDGSWTKHGNPSSPVPTSGCGGVENATSTPTSTNVALIEVDNPKPGDTVSSPLTVMGKARGTWYFEASFPIRVIDANGENIGGGIGQAQGDWMTSDFVPFKSEIKFNPPSTATGTIIFHNDNPSGLPQYDQELRVPVKFAPVETTKLKVFFGNNVKNPGASDCNLVYPVERVIAKTPAVARAALEELLAGPTQKEIDQGYLTTINSGVTIQKLTIENGVAKIDFDKILELQVGGSCRVTTIRAQITRTLLQFPNIKDVVISIDGRTQDILQP